MRDDATPLSLLDRLELVKTAIGMIDEGVDYLREEALEEGALETDEMLATMEDMRSDSYISMLHTMVCDEDEARQIVRLLMMEGRRR